MEMFYATIPKYAYRPVRVAGDLPVKFQFRFLQVPTEYETMHEVCSTRFGPEVANYIISAFCRGVFAADSRQLSMKAAFPPMWKILKPREVND